jgi:hypothetical protein
MYVCVSSLFLFLPADHHSQTATSTSSYSNPHNQVRVNTISAGPLKSRAASAIGGGGGKKTFIEYAIGYSKANAPLAQDLYADDVGTTGLFLASDLSRCVTGVTLYVDNGLHVRACVIGVYVLWGGGAGRATRAVQCTQNLILYHFLFSHHHHHHPLNQPKTGHGHGAGLRGHAGLPGLR